MGSSFGVHSSGKCDCWWQLEDSGEKAGSAARGEVLPEGLAPGTILQTDRGLHHQRPTLHELRALSK